MRRGIYGSSFFRNRHGLARSSCGARNALDRTARGAGGPGTWHDRVGLETSRWGAGGGTWPGRHAKKKRRPREYSKSVEVGLSPPTGRFLAACISSFSS